MPKIKTEIPNTGSLRDDIYAYLRGLSEPMKSIGAQTIRGLMMEPLMWNTIRAAMSQAIRSRVESKDKVAEALMGI
ncbi:hypothetical protein [Caproicibacter sp. BJN0012]|uniref:hypothetical protein n=1 Tax=Caproicibacter sp. BJN0012 TaxID=3110227 RepID=UPI002E0D268C